MQPRRVATFVLLGPFLVWLTIFIQHLPRLVRLPDKGALSFFMVAIIIVVVIGLIPALLLAGADELMARRRLAPGWRAAVCAVLAYPAAMITVTIALRETGLWSSFANEIYFAGLFAVIPAAVCSWFAGRGTEVSEPAR